MSPAKLVIDDDGKLKIQHNTRPVIDTDDKELTVRLNPKQGKLVVAQDGRVLHHGLASQGAISHVVNPDGVIGGDVINLDTNSPVNKVIANANDVGGGEANILTQGLLLLTLDGGCITNFLNIRSMFISFI